MVLLSKGEGGRARCQEVKIILTLGDERGKRGMEGGEAMVERAQGGRSSRQGFEQRRKKRMSSSGHVFRAWISARHSMTQSNNKSTPG